MLQKFPTLCDTDHMSTDTVLIYPAYVSLSFSLSDSLADAHHHGCNSQYNSPNPCLFNPQASESIYTDQEFRETEPPHLAAEIKICNQGYLDLRKTVSDLHPNPYSNSG